jgi:hypothetical protein
MRFAKSPLFIALYRLTRFPAAVRGPVDLRVMRRERDSAAIVSPGPLLEWAGTNSDSLTFSLCLGVSILRASQIEKGRLNCARPNQDFTFFESNPWGRTSIISLSANCRCIPDFATESSLFLR